MYCLLTSAMKNSSNVHTITGGKPKYRPCRPHDYIYDPNHVVSGPKDHQRCVLQAAKTEAEFQVCPNFPTMFSDLPKYPRMRLALHCTDRVPSYIDKSWMGKQLALSEQPLKMVEVNGADRHHFFRRPMVPFMHPVFPSIRFDQEITALQRTSEVQERSEPVNHTRATQTDYRESETQTVPWAPPFNTASDTSPEILSLAMLSWGNGLPAGMHEVQIIERARVKRAWESSLPPMDDPNAMDERRRIVEAMEKDEWAFREQEIETIHKMRLQLAKQLLKDTQKDLSVRLTQRLNRYTAMKQLEKETKLKQIRHDKDRALRKLNLKHRGVNMKYQKTNIIDDHADHKSELFGPQIRFGDNPKRWHEVINIRSRFLTHLKGLEILENSPSKWLPAFDYIKAAAPKQTHILCIRETRWTEEVLQKLHEDLKAIRLKRFLDKSSLGLIIKVHKPVPAPETPEIEGVSDNEEDVYQASIFLQKVIKGRALQSLMWKGREKCQELINELKEAHALNEVKISQLNEERLEMVASHRNELLIKYEEDRLSELVSSFEGQTVGTLLDFLSKELWRLQDERRAHAFALLAERERHRREAAEAGRRQAEERRRREHDEIFKQVIKVHQDTVDLYLEDIILESMDWVAEAEARCYVTEMVKVIDKASHEAQLRSDAIEEEELVADLIHNFVVPEVEKHIIRKNMRIRQEKYLRAAHSLIYDKLDPVPEPLPSHSKVDETSSEQSAAKDEDDSTNIKALIDDVCNELIARTVDQPEDQSDIIDALLDNVMAAQQDENLNNVDEMIENVHSEMVNQQNDDLNNIDTIIEDVEQYNDEEEQDENDPVGGEDKLQKDTFSLDEEESLQ